MLRLERPSGRRARYLIVSPLPLADALLEPETRGFSVSDPERVPEQEIAERLGITANTVRFHLKQLFAKTGTRRQSELVRLFLTTMQVRRADGSHS